MHKHVGVSAGCVKKHWQTYRPQHQRDTGVFPDQPRDAMLPGCPGSSPRNPPKWTCHEVPSQTFKLHQQQLYSEHHENNQAPPFFSKSEFIHPEAHFHSLHLQSVTTNTVRLQMQTDLSLSSCSFPFIIGQVSLPNLTLSRPKKKLTIKAIKRICDKDGDLDKIGRKD